MTTHSVSGGPRRGDLEGALRYLVSLGKPTLVGEGADMVVGNKGDDQLLSEGGRDHVDGQDLGPAGIGGSDVLDCGPGFDTFEADFDDKVLPNCEKGVVGGS